MKFKHVIWDWNGTILNDVWLCVEAMNVLLKKYNLSLVDEKFYKSVFDFPVKNYYEKLGFDFNIMNFNIIGSEFIDEYNKKISKIKLFNGAMETIQMLHKNNIKQSLLSAREHQQLVKELEHFELSTFFSDVIGLQHNYADSKLENGKLFIQKYKKELDSIVMIGDTKHDYEVASEMGIHCILISHGHNTRERLEGLGIDIVEDMNELKKKIINY